MSEPTLEDFFTQSEAYGEEEYSQIPEGYRETINEILRGLSESSEETEESITQ
ncbi:hypothetical protein B4589_008410 [Halolamina sp. CBA1230]|uniref:hypothetical protein n=1 Tax=Halolamina sp. CBA1230 TaxID=1853690 RepID=UPI001301EB84|nr:hypothetical protein [Halolamina sp. CBA1230]QKY20400.1 hypothetical protein B4589_008410 [Halolamina sp. CBA1230]